jgi:hypothetical protein
MLPCMLRLHPSTYQRLIRLSIEGRKMGLAVEPNLFAP